jgi:hypothetical protein
MPVGHADMVGGRSTRWKESVKKSSWSGERVSFG